MEEKERLDKIKEICELTDIQYKMIRWWEQELTDEERGIIFKEENCKWNGSIEERQAKLEYFYDKYSKVYPKK